jgi:hypothetical protein
MASTAQWSAMLVDMFEPVGAVRLSGNLLVDFHQGAVAHLGDGRRAKVVSVLSVKTSGCVVRCEVPAARPR